MTRNSPRRTPTESPTEDPDKVLFLWPKNSFDCPVCFEETSPEDGIRLRGCEDSVCKKCIIEELKHNVNGFLLCPVCGDWKEDRDIVHIVERDLWKQVLSRRLDYGMSINSSGFKCATPDCEAWVEVVEEVPTFLCPSCKVSNCIKCKSIHTGPCVQNEDLDQFKEREGDMIMPCVQCLCAITWDPTIGCSWAKCPKCKTELCLATRGLRWGPNGKGDTSGGCRCNVDGKKCHPNCINCH